LSGSARQARHNPWHPRPGATAADRTAPTVSDDLPRLPPSTWCANACGPPSHRTHRYAPGAYEARYCQHDVLLLIGANSLSARLALSCWSVKASDSPYGCESVQYRLVGWNQYGK